MTVIAKKIMTNVIKMNCDNLFALFVVYGVSINNLKAPMSLKVSILWGGYW